MTSRQFTKTWWGEKWLDSLNNVYWTNRIGRGKTYANTGRVYDILIKDNLALAKVKGNYRSYYNVSVEFKLFTQKEKNIIIKTIYENPLILSALLNHKLPKDLYQILSDEGVNVFPSSSHDLDTSCNCPDYAVICKHIAGLVHMIALEIDKDPFLIFKMQGLDLLNSLNYNTNEDSIKNVSKLFTNHDSEIKGEIDFSKIPDLHNEIFQLLDENPVFYRKDFKKILDNVYKALSRYLKRSVDNYTRLNKFNSYEDFIYLDSEFPVLKDESTDWLENTFLQKWGMPNQ